MHTLLIVWAGAPQILCWWVMLRLNVSDCADHAMWSIHHHLSTGLRFSNAHFGGLLLNLRSQFRNSQCVHHMNTYTVILSSYWRLAFLQRFEWKEHESCLLTSWLATTCMVTARQILVSGARWKQGGLNVDRNTARSTTLVLESSQRSPSHKIEHLCQHLPR